MSEEDRRIRDQIKAKDLDLSESLREQMQQQQEQLKEYFSDYKKPVEKDPTVIEKPQTNAQSSRPKLKDVGRAFTVFGEFSRFWSMKGTTYDQNQTLKRCRQKIITNITLGMAVGGAITSLVSYRYWLYFPRYFHAIGATTAIFTGVMVGIASSSKYCLQQFEALGIDSNYGRTVISDIERKRLNKAKEEC